MSSVPLTLLSNQRLNIHNLRIFIDESIGSLDFVAEIAFYKVQVMVS